ncbi:23607_t:CDS:2 [Cetraspora pellucida]|uniref:23607_t:CDS:1 n=1 Tax=Cetraspora pellucida TaxID=1433469 RepID=A0A9N8ZGK6_9GLOM|nr:23607_t:CDS:2 [Cetraspora pellucida]
MSAAPGENGEQSIPIEDVANNAEVETPKEPASEETKPQEKTAVVESEVTGVKPIAQEENAVDKNEKPEEVVVVKPEEVVAKPEEAATSTGGVTTQTEETVADVSTEETKAEIVQTTVETTTEVTVETTEAVTDANDQPTEPSTDATQTDINKPLPETPSETSPNPPKAPSKRKSFLLRAKNFFSSSKKQ